MVKDIQNIFETWIKDDGEDFSGVFCLADESGILYQQVHGYRHMAEKLPNAADTAFAIASGTKLFTALAVCKLIDQGKLSLDDKICDILSRDLGQIDKRVTILHLLTHTSGVGDYVDEDAEDFDAMMTALRNTYPAHLWTNLEYYLQMITHLPQKFEPDARYGYSNSGFILLGLAVEAVSGMSYHKFVKDNIIMSCGMTHTDFYRSNALPPNTTPGHIYDEETDTYRTNIFDVPIMGGADGGIYTTAPDLDKLWRNIFANKVLSEEMTQNFLKYQVTIDEECGESYGLGIYRNEEQGNLSYYVMGVDEGVRCITAYFPQSKMVLTALGNKDVWLFDLLDEAFKVLK
ncbi:MAG: beta-lactamase family protein [Defluviitaleaceae bacterium]|nr:beta-lactamase family protein [Defluviitaleaceae bacterium]